MLVRMFLSSVPAAEEDEHENDQEHKNDQDNDDLDVIPGRRRMPRASALNHQKLIRGPAVIRQQIILSLSKGHPRCGRGRNSYLRQTYFRRRSPRRHRCRPGLRDESG